MKRNLSSYVSSAKAATMMGFSQDYVRKLILCGKLKAQKIGRNWIIDTKDLEKIHRQRFARTKE